MDEARSQYEIRIIFPLEWRDIRMGRLITVPGLRETSDAG